VLWHRRLFSRDDISFEDGEGVRRVAWDECGGYDNMDAEVEAK
jgi:hypothetical protein